MHQKSLQQLINDLRAKQYSSRELTEYFLHRIKKFDPQLNSFITPCQEYALVAAKAADDKIAAGTASSLTGIPLAHKDIFCTDGIKTSCASKMLDNFIAPYDATVVSKLKQAGTVMLGKTNMDEFAMGSSNENSHYGAVKNPWDITRVPGGSSGGSAAAVAAGLVPVATGTDTGGSIRQPAAFCGLTGIKPTYGRVSRYGMVAFASSLDQAGILAKSAADAALVLQEMAGFDPKDSTSINRAVPDYVSVLNNSLAGLTIGLPKEYFSADVDPAISENVVGAAKQFEQLGAKLKEIHLPHTHLAIAAYYVIAPAECSSNLARFDGVRYGYRCANPRDIHDLYCRSRSEGFGREVKRRIMIGTYSLSAGYYDAYYLKAQQIRRLVSNDFLNAFCDVDVILGPTTPSCAFQLNAKTADPVSMYLSDIFTLGVNLAGLPGISFASGFKGNLPIGTQLIGKHFAEDQLLNFVHRYQQVTDWHLKSPVFSS